MYTSEQQERRVQLGEEGGGGPRREPWQHTGESGACCSTPFKPSGEREGEAEREIRDGKRERQRRRETQRQRDTDRDTDRHGERENEIQ